MSFFVVICHQTDVNCNKEGKDQRLNHANKNLIKIKWYRYYLRCHASHAGQEIFAPEHIAKQAKG